jgi:hypothetical protein
MPIHGKITARPEDYRVGLIQVGEKVYLEPEEIIVTRRGVILDTFSPIAYIDDIDPDEIKYLICIERIGHGMTEADFRLTFPETLEYEFIIEANVRYLEALHEKLFTIIFHDFQMNLSYLSPSITKKQESKSQSLSLQEQLDLAIKNQNFEAAAKLRDKINKQKKSKSQGNKSKN